MIFYVCLGVIVSLYVGYGMYYYLSIKSKHIIIYKKFVVHINGQVIRKISDSDKVEYSLVPGMLISGAKCDYLWDHMDENEKVVVKYCGVDCPVVGMHYSIVDVGDN